MGSLSSAASKAGMSTGCDDARFQAKPKHLCAQNAAARLGGDYAGLSGGFGPATATHGCWALPLGVGGSKPALPSRSSATARRHERIARVLVNCMTPEKTVPPMPKAMKEKKSRIAAVLPLVSST